MRIISDSEVFEAVEAGADLTWTEDELHNAMQHHFSEWRDEPQWKLYLLIATHFKLYPQYLVTGIMYDSQYRDPNDLFPRQGKGFIPIQQLAWFKPTQPGRYRLRLRFDATESDPRQWRGHTFVRDQRRVENLIQQVPHVEVQSNTLEIELD